jgi:hypothetical protein
MTKTSHNSLTSVSAPAYRAIRTNRYLFVQYASGAQELYDMLRDPAQVHSLTATPAYRGVKAFLAAALLKLEICHGSPCDAAIAADPAPVGGATSRLRDGGGGGKKRRGAATRKPKAGSKK